MSFDISNLNAKVDLADGEWIDDIPDHPGLRLRVRSARYKPYRVALSAFYRANNKSIQTDEGFVDAQADTGKFLAAHLLLDWDQSKAKGPNALTDKGKPVAYSPELALAILSADDDLGIGDEYRGAVAYAAGKVSERLLAKTKAASGN